MDLVEVIGRVPTIARNDGQKAQTTMARTKATKQVVTQCEKLRRCDTEAIGSFKVHSRVNDEVLSSDSYWSLSHPRAGDRAILDYRRVLRVGPAPPERAGGRPFNARQ
jgi:hypothetical protein